MLRYFAALGVIAALIGIAQPSHAQQTTVVQSCGTLANKNQVGSTGVIAIDINGNLCNSSVGSSTITYDIRNFGAKCDGSTDDSTAINATIAAAKLTKTLYYGTVIEIPEGQGCVIKSTLNFTGIVSTTNVNVTVRGNGTALICQTTGAPCVDALGSTFIVWDHVTIYGDAANKPTFGIQIGRINTTALDSGGNAMVFKDLNVTGTFSVASCYNFSGEGVVWYNANCENGDTGATAHAMIQDGINHFGVTSAFVTEAAPADTPQSFNSNQFIGGQIRLLGNTNAGATPIWYAGGRKHVYKNLFCYNSAGAYCTELYTVSGIGQSGGVNETLEWGLHAEGSAAFTDMFFITGTNTTPVFKDFSFTEGYLFAKTNIFKLDSGITATFQNLDLRVSGGPASPTATVFDVPASYTVSGKVYLYNASMWIIPTSFSGTVDLAGTVSSYLSTTQNVIANAAGLPVSPLNINGDMIIDQPHEGASVLSSASGLRLLDGWRTAQTQNNKITFQRSAVAPGAYTNSLLISVTTPLTPAITDRMELRSIITALDMQSLRYGTASAVSSTLSFWVMGNASFTYPLTLSVALENNNAGGSYRSFVHAFTLAAASTWYRVSITVPGDTNAGTWFGSTFGAVGMNLMFELFCGSNFQTAALDAWATGQFYCSTTSTQVSSVTGATLNITGVHLRAGAYDNPYQPEPYRIAFMRAQSRYFKTFSPGTAPATNAGANTGEFQFPATVAGAGTQISPRLVFPNQMDVGNGTVTYFNPSAANAVCRDETAAGDGGAVTTANQNANGINITCAGNAGTAAGNLMGVHVTVDSNL